VERAQRVLKQEEVDLRRQRSVLSQEESELKDCETAQSIERENCKVKDSTLDCPQTNQTIAGRCGGRTTAHLRCKAFNQAFQERRVASQVTRQGNSKSACKKPDLSLAWVG
jgi:hypothetical protein